MKTNKDIIFIGNINYLPNKIACFDFIKVRTDLDLEGWQEQDIFKH